MKQVVYQIFGSEDSTDLDVCFFVDEIGSIVHSKSVLDKLESDFVMSLGREVNGNLAVVKDGELLSCFKGTPDELNNALYLTYSLHQQDFPAQIKRLVKRDVYAKIVRCNRTIISYLSRTAIRKEVKAVLHKSEQDKLLFLQGLVLIDYDDFKKNGSKVDVYKSFAFQLGQTIGLLEGKELYTKSGIGKCYPVLKSYLNREKQSGEELDKMIKLYVKLARNWLVKNQINE